VPEKTHTCLGAVAAPNNVALMDCCFDRTLADTLLGLQPRAQLLFLPKHSKHAAVQLR
jgi:hypothetical protein